MHLPWSSQVPFRWYTDDSSTALVCKWFYLSQQTEDQRQYPICFAGGLLPMTTAAWMGMSIWNFQWMIFHMAFWSLMILLHKSYVLPSEHEGFSWKHSDHDTWKGLLTNIMELPLSLYPWDIENYTYAHCHPWGSWMVESMMETSWPVCPAFCGTILHSSGLSTLWNHAIIFPNSAFVCALSSDWTEDNFAKASKAGGGGGVKDRGFSL